MSGEMRHLLWLKTRYLLMLFGLRATSGVYQKSVRKSPLHETLIKVYLYGDRGIHDIRDDTKRLGKRPF